MKFNYSLQVYNNKMGKFKATYDLQKRKQIYEKDSKLHPGKLGIIIEIHPKAKIQINRFFKFMANSNYTINIIKQLIRKQLSQNHDQFKNTALFLFIKDKITQPSKKLSQYVDKKQEDNFIYFYLAETQTF